MSNNIDANDEEFSHSRYSAMANSWYLNSLELDKSLLTISAGGIGLSFTLIQIFKSSIILYFMISAALLFTITIGIILAVFNLNGSRINQRMHSEIDYVKSGNFIHSQEAVLLEGVLKFLDKIKMATFFIGVIIFLIAMFFAGPNENTEEAKSTEKISTPVCDQCKCDSGNNSNHINITISDKSKPIYQKPPSKKVEARCFKNVSSEPLH